MPTPWIRTVCVESRFLLTRVGKNLGLTWFFPPKILPTLNAQNYNWILNLANYVSYQPSQWHFLRTPEVQLENILPCCIVSNFVDNNSYYICNKKCEPRTWLWKTHSNFEQKNITHKNRSLNALQWSLSGSTPLERPSCLERPFSNLWKYLSTIGLHANWTCLERPPVWKDHLVLTSRVIVPDRVHCIGCLHIAKIQYNTHWTLMPFLNHTKSY